MQIFSDKSNSYDKGSYILAKFINFVTKITPIMITKARIKLIKSLEQRKQRNLQHLFVAEGPKLVGELLATMQPSYIAALPEWWKENKYNIRQKMNANLSDTNRRCGMCIEYADDLEKVKAEYENNQANSFDINGRYNNN